MTISKSAWNEIITEYRKHVLVKRAGDPNEAPQDVIEADGIDLVCEDILARLRTTAIPQFIDPESGDLRRITCAGFMQNLLTEPLKTLHNTPVDTYVICIDPYGMRRGEKLGTFLQRQRPVAPGAPEFLTMPLGQTRFFEDNAEMPGTMELIFNTPQAKAELYEYLTELLRSGDFRKDIPDGKVLILSGALKITREEGVPFSKKCVTLLPPLKVTREGYSYIDEINSDHISEGDVDVWRWVDYFKTKAFRVKSYDCDVFLAGLLQMRHIMANNPTRQGWFVTRRSIGSVEYTEEQVQKKESMKILKSAAYITALQSTGSVNEAYRASGGLVPAASLLASCSSSAVSDDPSGHNDPELYLPSDIPRKRMRSVPDWAEHHIDMFGIYDEIIKEAYQLVETHCLPLQNPVETYVMCICLASDKHDYIQTKRVSPGIGPHFLWKALKPNLWKIGDMVRVCKPPPNFALPYPERTHFYEVNVESLTTLVKCAYQLKAIDALKPSKKNNTPEKLDKARQLKADGMFTKNVSKDDIQVVAAQCAWVLQYWGNGAFSGYTIADGLTLDENGNSLYGYESVDKHGKTPNGEDGNGWAKKVTHTLTKFSPPIPDGLLEMVPDEDKVKEESA